MWTYYKKNGMVLNWKTFFEKSNTFYQAFSNKNVKEGTESCTFKELDSCT